MTARYPVGPQLRQIEALFAVSPERILRRIGLFSEAAHHQDILVNPVQFFQIWDAISAEASRPGIEMELAMAYAHAPFIAPIFAFSCAETLALGLARLRDFKPLAVPVKMTIERPDEHLHLTIESSVPGLAIPPNMGLFELLYITECARISTGTKVTPISASLSGQVEIDEACTDYLGIRPDKGSKVTIIFAKDDAKLPLVTRSASMWEILEPGLNEKLDKLNQTATWGSRLKRTLAVALPGGNASIHGLARRMNISQRSLQRHLGSEGTSFQKLLNETRLEMAKQYLKENGLSVTEIAFLLGYRDASSFFRAFHSWTGMTPGQFRANRLPKATVP